LNYKKVESILEEVMKMLNTITKNLKSWKKFDKNFPQFFLDIYYGIDNIQLLTPPPLASANGGFFIGSIRVKI
jgi:hypothetical protein